MAGLTLSMENNLSEEILNAAVTCRLRNPDPKDLDHWSNDDKHTESESPSLSRSVWMFAAAAAGGRNHSPTTEFCHLVPSLLLPPPWLAPQQKLHLILSKTPE